MQDDVASELAALRARVRRLEDREEIRELTCEYMQAMHDAHLARPPRGRRELRPRRPRPSPEPGRPARLLPALHAGLRGRRRLGLPLLADPVIHVDGDRAEGRWLLLTLATDPDGGEASSTMSTLDYEYQRERGRWRFHRKHSVHEHLLVPYAKGWGRSGASRIPDAAMNAPPEHFARLRAQGGKQRLGRLTRSIRGWSVPTLEPAAARGERRSTD